ncbi:acylneuraminate cytidylyltransferase [Paenibacillus sp. OT2-17]|jgi:spore coat polysaccharide biosynthesis protein SpsF|uniref:cytidylyltransferase domain-containing protein n=1 Tax=Paenibacillus sp. OT2-17 TaxID=2691605 RepID=UPI001352CFF1|nr:glycosyltransferase family protein [Paenibacillus sp. OT2-17]MXO76675.1 acylneuraminate cytidylyltransferase [Paenibacillus sp. OT2-17]
MNIVAIIQARMGSTRLPGKVDLNLLGVTVLERVVERIKKVKQINKIVVATTDLTADETIVNLAHKAEVEVYRGSESDVLKRYYEAAVTYNADVIIRITSDCPVIDPVIIDELIKNYIMGSYDYVSNTIERSYPRGLDAEVFSFASLEKAHLEAKSTEQREHVTPYIYQNPDQFSLLSVTYPKDYSNYRWTLDTIEDWELIQQIYTYIKDRNSFDWQDVLELMETRPEIALINSHVEQKKLKGEE